MSIPRRMVSYSIDFGDDAGTDGTAAFADSEAQAVFHGDRNDQFNRHLNIVTGHHHLRAFRQ